MKVMSARLARRWEIYGAVLIFLGLFYWLFRHVVSLLEVSKGHREASWIYVFAFGLLLVQVILCYFEKTYKTTAEQQAKLDEASLVVNVPVYNEDPSALQSCLNSLMNQSRVPDLIFVVDDGSTVDYSDTQEWFEQAATEASVAFKWERQPNAGKRHAQGRTVRATPEADFYLTIDSDAILDYHACEEGLKPFVNPEIHSVAGVVMVSNRVNLLTKMSDLWFVLGQLVDRSSMSAVGSVLVNSGCIAFYRGEMLRKNLDGYLNEYFFGRAVELSDDSMLTIYALMEGKAVQQPTAFAFTLMPENYSHHRRQYLRWMRGAFIRAWWRFKYLPLTSPSYWLHLFGWVQMALSTLVFSVLFIYTPTVAPEMLPYFVVVPIIVGYGQGLRYFMIKRSDMNLWSQFGIFLMTPVIVLYGFFVLRMLRFYAIATCRQAGWGTRQTVELAQEAV
jgi:hyaluronan synthase